MVNAAGYWGLACYLAIIAVGIATLGMLGGVAMLALMRRHLWPPRGPSSDDKGD